VTRSKNRTLGWGKGPLEKHKERKRGESEENIWVYGIVQFVRMEEAGTYHRLHKQGPCGKPGRQGELKL